MDKRFLLILAALAIVFGGIFFFSKAKSSAPGKSGSSSAVSNHTLGTGTKVKLVEYGDYQCPACGQFFPIVKQLQAKYADQMTFRFAHFPLVQIHQNAMAGARAAEAASLQGKFWEMHDLLYQNQNSWSASSDPNPYFVQYATSLGLDVTKYKQDMASQAVLNTINADTSEVQALGASGTPTFVLNGKKIENPNSLEAFSQVIDEAIKNASQQ
jgi:protein-disulfide isomerase